MAQEKKTDITYGTKMMVHYLARAKEKYLLTRK